MRYTNRHFTYLLTFLLTPFCFLTAFSHFSIVQWIFELSQTLNGDLLPFFCLPLSGPVDLQTEVVGLHTINPAGYPKFSNLKD